MFFCHNYNNNYLMTVSYLTYLVTVSYLIYLKIHDREGPAQIY